MRNTFIFKSSDLGFLNTTTIYSLVLHGTISAPALSSLKCKFLGISSSLYKFSLLEKNKIGNEINLSIGNYGKQWTVKVDFIEDTYKLREGELDYFINTYHPRLLAFPVENCGVNPDIPYTLFTFELHDEVRTNIKKYKVHRCYIDTDSLICNCLGSYNYFDYESYKRPIVLARNSYMVHWCLVEPYV
jgi:hypothetical protein